MFNVDVFKCLIVYDCHFISFICTVTIKRFKLSCVQLALLSFWRSRASFFECKIEPGRTALNYLQKKLCVQELRLVETGLWNLRFATCNTSMWSIKECILSQSKCLQDAWRTWKPLEQIKNVRYNFPSMVISHSRSIFWYSWILLLRLYWSVQKLRFGSFDWTKTIVPSVVTWKTDAYNLSHFYILVPRCRSRFIGSYILLYCAVTVVT